MANYFNTLRYSSVVKMSTLFAFTPFSGTVTKTIFSVCSHVKSFTARGIVPNYYSFTTQYAPWRNDLVKITSKDQARKLLFWHVAILRCKRQNYFIVIITWSTQLLKTPHNKILCYKVIKHFYSYVRSIYQMIIITYNNYNKFFMRVN